MKKCPQCNTLYKDELGFCLSDGTPLIKQELPISAPDDSDETETVITPAPVKVDFSAGSSKPIVIDFSAGNSKPFVVDLSDSETVVTPSREAQNLPHNLNLPAPNLQNPDSTTIITKDSTSKFGNYTLFLILGLLIGGGLVLGTLLLAKNFFQNNNVNANNAAPTEKTVATPEVKTGNAENVSPAAARHEKPNESANANLLNGNVIAANAYVRAAPNTSAPIIDTLPINDRLEIGERENPTSPWYKVTCEHGTTGWMHGNTITFTKDNF